MWLARLRAANSLRLLNKELRQFHPNRPLQLSACQNKWISAEEAKKIEEVPVGTKFGAVDNPVWHTHGSSGHREGDEWKEFYYREPTKHNLYLDRLVATAIGTLFWFWVTYRFYYDYQMFTGHFYMPYLSEFSDEELGIPPDSAPDPEYWGNHGKKYGTYR